MNWFPPQSVCSPMGCWQTQFVKLIKDIISIAEQCKPVVAYN